MVLLLSGFAAALPATAQGGHTLGVKAGWGSPSPTASDTVFTLENTEGSGGFVGGISWEGGLWKGWSLEGEVLYARRKVSIDYSGVLPGGGITTVGFDIETLEVPFHAKYAFSGGSTRPYVLGGWVTAIPLSVEQQGTAFGDATTASDKHEFKGVWLALEAGVGVEQRLGGDLGIGVDVRYVYGLNNVRDVEGESIKMRDLRVIAALKIGL
jgi:hypothetical protein